MNVTAKARLDRQFGSIRTLTKPIARAERSNFDITSVKKGGFIRFSGQVYQVTEVSTYQETDDSFKKKLSFVSTELALFNVLTGETIYVEWDRDDEVTVWRSVSKVKTTQIIDEDGNAVDTEDLDEYCEAGEELKVNRKVYEYDDDWPAVYKRSADAKPIKVYFYEFAASDGENLTIEEWQEGEEDSYEAWLSVSLPVRSIEVIATGDEEK